MQEKARVPFELALTTHSSGALLGLLKSPKASESMMPRIYNKHIRVRPSEYSIEGNYDNVATTYCKNATNNSTDACEELKKAHTVLFNAEHDRRKRIGERDHCKFMARPVGQSSEQ